MTVKLWLAGKLPSLNEFVDANRSHWAIGAKLKEGVQTDLFKQIDDQNPPALTGRHDYTFIWYEESRRRDPDNITGGGCKVIFDALQDAGVIERDGWKQVASIHHEFRIDKQRPGVQVIIEEEK